MDKALGDYLTHHFNDYFDKLPDVFAAVKESNMRDKERIESYFAERYQGRTIFDVYSKMTNCEVLLVYASPLTFPVAQPYGLDILSSVLGSLLIS